MTTPIKELHLPIAEGLSGHNPKPVKIIIAHKIKTFGSVNTLCKLRMYYDEQAYLLADALLLSLPQGVIEPLIIHLLKNRVSLYSGTMVKGD